VVIVTHDVPQARRVSDNLAFLYAGHLVEFGETATLFANPREEATRDYLAGALVTGAEEAELEEVRAAAIVA
jgi:phosphate transport system ATP-binding protein